MANIIDSLKANLGRIYRILLFVASCVIIIYFFPKSGKFKYSFENGRPWQSDNLYAPFDFAIKKTDKELDAEKTKIKLATKVFFNKDTLVFNKSLNLLYSKIDNPSNDSIINTLSKRELKLIKNTSVTILSNLYSRGLLDQNYDYKSSQVISLLINNKQVNSGYFSDFHKPEDLLTFINNEIISLNVQEFKPQIVSILFDLAESNISLNQSLTKNSIEEALANVSPNRGIIEKETLIISKGELVEGDKLKILESLKNEYETSSVSKTNYYLIISSYSFLVILSLLMIILFIRKFRKKIYLNINQLSLVFFNITLLVLITTFVISVESSYVFVIPICILPLLLKAFFDSRIAFFVHSVTVMLLGFIVPNSYEFIFLNIIVGVITIISSDDLYKRANLFITVGQITIVYMISYFAFFVIHEGNIDNIEIFNFLLFMLCGLLTLFVYPLIYIYEKVFNLVSDVSLLELSDTNSPLLKELSNKAPGTFHHSMNVANLAESSANEIGANSMLARVGSLYHDIGKMNNPSYFTENQITGANPHDKVSSLESINIILDHVSKGIEMAKKNNLPNRIIDFIRTHHGTNVIHYFYEKDLKLNLNPNIEDYKYSGPRPFSKETALVMMCDSVEAATKSLENPDSEKINSFVETIIDKQISNNQFENCSITFKDIKMIKDVIKKKLANIYHIRVEYPEI
ncbi:MAG: HDIG domain-containing protein [Flavobacteriaceae bacterium]|jgi:cyclic-di-AMP phosphodiesterase PgpH|nr:HDIG domain-containing protein [Flavobacteriaceae bacterium]MBT4112549.1 HDIG domain-containing protein [Flavobacteriaceae bacterium]MBT4614403.1 HDIG domain-containing protein [Flavobacteriaceae bacterium]MBT5246856.1 HDIG domain-containing protein [Flavobacteriaceae bacterium]MBT5650041.1 HDIG domain-containing protein [Flavobacteriaceae bacterium]